MAGFPTLSLYQFDEHGVEHEWYVNTFTEHLRKHHAHVLLPHKHDFYLAVLFTHGSGFHEIDFRRFDVQPGAVFFLHPGQTHHWGFSDDVEGYIFCHSLAYYQLNFPNRQLSDFPFFFSRRNEPYLQLSAGQVPAIAQQFETLLTEYQSQQSRKYRKLASLLDALYIDLSRAYERVYSQRLDDVHRYADKFRAFEQLVNEHFLTEKSAAFYADRLAISTKHLNRISRESVGKTSTEVITERVMLEAKRLLSSGSRNLNEAALQLGYEEYAYFSRLFRQHCHESPREFQQRYH